jgi:hypothetical protein
MVARTRKKLLAIDLGTFCDNKLMEIALQDLKKVYTIVYLTDRRHALSKEFVVEHFNTPSFFINDPAIPSANTSRSFAAWLLQHPLQAREAYVWRADMCTKIRKLVDTHTPEAMVILYPALGVLWMIDDEIAKRVPAIVLFYAPGIIANNIPWLFDSLLRNEKHPLFKRSHKNIDSGREYLSRISIQSSRGIGTTIEDVYRMAHHVCCWDVAIMPKIQPAIKGLNIHVAGALLSPDLKRKQVATDLPANVRNVLKHKKLVFVSFGSYSSSPALQAFLPKFMNALETFCSSHGYKVVFHMGNINNACVVSHVGYLPYELIVPKSSLVIFTGSACLQNVCMYHAVPMLYVPQLNEQFFWARTYKKNTGAPYVDLTDDKALHSLRFDKLMRSGKEYLQRVSRSMRTPGNDASKNLVKIVSDVGKQHIRVSEHGVA